MPRDKKSIAFPVLIDMNGVPIPDFNRSSSKIFAMKILLAYLLAFCLLRNTLSVDRNNFKTCDQSSFCRYF